MAAIQVEKKVQMSLEDIIILQLLMHCHLENLVVSKADMQCMARLAILGEQEIGDFCLMVVEDNIFQSIQTVRNVITKLEKKGLILKDGRSKKKIRINPVLNVQTQGTILLDYKFLYRDAA